jgi:hypothetical protein
MQPPGGKPASATHKRRSPYETWVAVFRWLRLALLVANGVVLLTAFIGFDMIAVAGHDHPPDHVALDIMPVKPGGPAQNYAAYTPSTVLRVPAQSLVTFTIRNFDLDTVTLQGASPAAHVQGTEGGVAYADGRAYSALDQTGIAHTFTVPALHLNVPIPGHAASGKSYVTVTFRIHTGKAGTYDWRCFAPCGDGPEGQAGPMADDRYMRGTLFVAD